jgi:hypothetical protein
MACADGGIPSDEFKDWVRSTYSRAVTIIAGVFIELGFSPEHAEHNARACLARLALATPPITVELLSDER